MKRSFSQHASSHQISFVILKNVTWPPCGWTVHILYEFVFSHSLSSTRENSDAVWGDRHTCICCYLYYLQYRKWFNEFTSLQRFDITFMWFACQVSAVAPNWITDSFPDRYVSQNRGCFDPSALCIGFSLMTQVLKMAMFTSVVSYFHVPLRIFHIWTCQHILSN